MKLGLVVCAGDDVHSDFGEVLLNNVTLFRLTLKLSCAMNFMIYPHDTQECSLQMESCKFVKHQKLINIENK